MDPASDQRAVVPGGGALEGGAFSGANGALRLACASNISLSSGLAPLGLPLPTAPGDVPEAGAGDEKVLLGVRFTRPADEDELLESAAVVDEEGAGIAACVAATATTIGGVGVAAAWFGRGCVAPMPSAALASCALLGAACGLPLSPRVPGWAVFLLMSRLAATSCGGPPWVCCAKTAWKAGPVGAETGAPEVFEESAVVLPEGPVLEALGEALGEPGLVVTARFAIAEVLFVMH